jgi:hypothetical protein
LGWLVWAGTKSANRTLRALARQASAEDLEAAEMAAGHEQY